MGRMGILVSPKEMNRTPSDLDGSRYLDLRVDMNAVVKYGGKALWRELQGVLLGDVRHPYVSENHIPWQKIFLEVTSASQLTQDRLSQGDRGEINLVISPEVATHTPVIEIAQSLGYLKVHLAYTEIPPIFANCDLYLREQIELLLQKYPNLILGVPWDLPLRGLDRTSRFFDSQVRCLVRNEQIEPPKISIVIPTHNRSWYLSNTLRLIRQNDLSPEQYEILVIDDGSADDTVEMVRRHILQTESRHISLWSCQRAVGDAKTQNRVGMIRNIGIRESRADVILFLDSDILLPPWYLSKLVLLHEVADVVLPRRVNLSASTKHRNVAGFSDFTEVQDGEVLPWEDFWANFNRLESWGHLEHPWLAASTFALSAKRKMLIECGGFRSIFTKYGMEDTDLGYRLFKQTRHLMKISDPVFHQNHQNAADSEFRGEKNEREKQLGEMAWRFMVQTMDPTVHPPLRKLIQAYIRSVAKDAKREDGGHRSVEC